MIRKAMQGLWLVAALQAVNPSWAGIVDIEGSNTSAGNDEMSTAQDVGVVAGGIPLTIGGWIDLGNPDDVDFYRFSVPAALAGQEFFFDIDYADDWEQTGDNDEGLDAALWIFDADGRLIAWNDDSDFFEIGSSNKGSDPGSDRFGDHDSFIGGLSLADGTYFATVSYYVDDANALYQAQIVFDPLSFSGEGILGADPDSSFPAFCFDPAAGCTGGQYQLQIRTSFNDVPEPASLALVTLGLLGMYGRRRTSRQVFSLKS